MTTAGANHDIEIEQALLGAVLVTNDAISYVVDKLEPEHFFEPIHALVFEVCRKMIAEGKIASPLTVRTYLPKGMNIAGMNEAEYLAHLCAHSTTIINVPDFAKLITDYAVKRAIINEVRHLAADDSDPAEATRICIENIDAIRLGVVNREGKNTSASAMDAANDIVEHIARINSGEETAGGVPTGIKSLDEKIGGFIPGNLYITAGRPSMGKSTVAESLARQVASGGSGVYFFSWEMAQRPVAARLVADQALHAKHGSVAYDRILRGKVEEPEALMVAEAARDINAMQLPLEFDFATRATVAVIAAKCRRMNALMKRKYNAELGLVVLDYLKFIKPTNRYEGQRVLEVGETTGALKEMAMSLGVAVMLLVQLNRKVEDRSEKIPVLSDLRESGEIEQDADVVMFLYRESYYLRTDPRLNTDPVLTDRLEKCENKIQIIIAKNRQGAIGTVDLYCDMASSAIREDPTVLQNQRMEQQNRGLDGR